MSYSSSTMAEKDIKKMKGKYINFNLCVATKLYMHKLTLPLVYYIISFLYVHGHIVAELREALSKRGLPTDGLKAVLLSRLQEHLEKEEASSMEVDEPVEEPPVVEEPAEEEEPAVNNEPVASEPIAEEPVAYPPPEEEEDEQPSAKRQRHEEKEEINENETLALYAPPLEDDTYQQSDNIRTSSLAEPTMKLSGHKGSVYCLGEFAFCFISLYCNLIIVLSKLYLLLAYDPQGEYLASGSFDSTVLLWKGEFWIVFL